MLTLIFLLFFTSEICIAGNGRTYYTPHTGVYLQQSKGYNIQKHQQHITQAQAHVQRLQWHNIQQPQRHNIRQPEQHIQQLQQHTRQSQQHTQQPQRHGKQPQHYIQQPQRHLQQSQRYVQQPQHYVHQSQQQPQRYVQKPQQCSGGYCYIPPRPQSHAPVDMASRYVETEPSKRRISETKCYDTYFPVIPPTALAGGIFTEHGEFPYMVAIGWKTPTGGYDYQCGGTLIGSKFILTAAHCRSLKQQPPAVVRVGGERLDDNSSDSQPKEIAKIHLHPKYKRKQVYNDIAIIELKYDTGRVPACLWPRNAITFSTATVIGYGQTESVLSTSTDLLKADLQLHSNEVCKSYYTPRFRIENGLVDSQFCAGDFNKVKDTCPGDSGGPILVKTDINDREVPFILGVTSFGPGCALGTPGVYTRVFSYLDWIESIVWPRG